jgi:hypothetical protein
MPDPTADGPSLRVSECSKLTKVNRPSPDCSSLSPVIMSMGHIELSMASHLRHQDLRAWWTPQWGPELGGTPRRQPARLRGSRVPVQGAKQPLREPVRERQDWRAPQLQGQHINSGLKYACILCLLRCCSTPCYASRREVQVALGVP